MLVDMNDRLDTLLRAALENNTEFEWFVYFSTLAPLWRNQ